MDIRNGELTHKGDPLSIDPLPLDTIPSQRIRTIKDHKLLPLLRTGLQALAHRADVGVAAASDILHVIDEHINSSQHLTGWFSRITIE